MYETTILRQFAGLNLYTAYSGNMAYIIQVDKLPYDAKYVVCADAGYNGVEKRTEPDGRKWCVDRGTPNYLQEAG